MSNAPLSAASADGTAHADFVASHTAWHDQVEAARTAPYGPLSATALFWLGEAPQSFEGVPGTWRANPKTGAVTAEIPNDAGITRDGAPLTGASTADGSAASDGSGTGDESTNGDGSITVEFEPLSGTAGFLLEWGEKRIELAARSGRIALRPRDPKSPDLVEYAGTNTFPPAERWVVTGRFVPTQRDAVEIGSAAGTWAKQYQDSPGVAEFELDGETLRLTLFGAPEATSLQAIFADQTGEDLTYPAARTVGAERIPAEAGTDELIRIDFNRTQNLPCAYSASATCPLPPAENRLGVRIEAGELRPGVTLPA